MSSSAAAERSVLCDLMVEVGPDAPTLCGDWTTRDLAAHLVVRERRPDAMPGILSGFLADHSEQVRLAEAARSYEEIVERVRTGPPRWSPTAIEAVDKMVNTIEFFVHHEDVRRGSDDWTVRTLDPELDDTLFSLLSKMGKLMVRGAPVGVAFAAGGRPAVTLKQAEPLVTIRGPVSECVLFLYGRTCAEVTFDGPPDAVEQLRAAEFGI